MNLLPRRTSFQNAMTDRGRRAFGFLLRISLAVLAFGTVEARAAVHPVPLEPNTDSKKCLECHEETAKGKAVHSAMGKGCLSCHEVRVSKDVTRVKLITATASSLCVTCHADKKASEIKGSVHAPAVRDCLSCHSPHVSENKNLLLKPTSGGEKENLCSTCHKTGLHVAEKGSRHAALDAGCDSCHVTHKTGADPTEENQFHLTKSSPALCLDCHDPGDENLKKAHNNQPFEKANCVQCHDPHQSDSPKLMAKFQHAPFQGNGCDTCHAPAKDGKVVLTQTDTKVLCLTCHEDKGKAIESAKVQHPGAAGSCTDCHNPHAGRQPGLLRAQGNALCLECHGPESKPQRNDADHLLTIFNGTVKLLDDYYQKNKVAILPLRFGLGHPVEYHPVADVMDPTDQSKVKTKLSCLSCHQPHASAQSNLLVKDQQNNMAFCDNCHKNRMNMKDTTSPGN